MPDFRKMKPGTMLETDNGPAAFELYKPGNLRDQNVQVRFSKEKTKWYRESDVKILAVQNSTKN